MTTATVSLSLFAGFTFGFIYLILNGFRWASERLEGGEGTPSRDRCSRCGASFDQKEDGVCSMCQQYICSQCAIHYRHSWLCTACVSKTDETLNASNWVLSQLKSRFNSTVAVVRRYGRRQGDVRDFVEKIAENIVGGKLDDVRIDHLSYHPEYLELMAKYVDVLSLTVSRLMTSVQMIVDGENIDKTESPRDVHEQLKQLIQDIVLDASSRKCQNGIAERMTRLRSKTYEDILATAILNKIVQDCWYGYSGDPQQLQKNFTTELSSKIQEEWNNVINLMNNSDSIKLRNGSTKSLEMLLNDKNSLPRQVECNRKDSVDDVEDEHWKENWLLGRKLNESSVTMLIPSPSCETKPKIGDLEVDELSDLSDVEPVEVMVGMHELMHLQIQQQDLFVAYSINEKRKIATVKEKGIASFIEASKRRKHGKEDFYENEAMDDEVPTIASGFCIEEEENEDNAETDVDQTFMESIVEARNAVLESLTDEEPKNKKTQDLEFEDSRKFAASIEKDRDFEEIQHTNRTKVRVIEQVYADVIRSSKETNSPSISVKHLAKHFSNSKNSTDPMQSVNSLTCRNPRSPVNMSIDYWEKHLKNGYRE